MAIERSTLLMRLAAVTLAALAPLALWAAERAPSSDQPEAAQSVELFAAIEAGQLEVKLVPRNIREANLLIENKTSTPLNVRLPEAFAGVSVLAQFGRGGGGRGGGGGGGQSIGGGFGGGGFGGGGFGGGGFGGGGFNVPPERLVKVTAPCVCLEHGKPDPRPSMAYEIVPIERYTSDPLLKALLKLVGQKRVDYSVAQAAAWHVANGMSWEELADKRIERANGTREPYFGVDELHQALAMVRAAQQLAARDAADSPGQATSPGEAIQADEAAVADDAPAADDE